MPAFSFSAPNVSAEEEQAEKEALSETERQRIHDEVYGNDIALEETDELIARGLTMLEEALASLPLTEKSAYIEAKLRVPEIVERESPHLRFLRVSEWDAWAACRRLTSYWTVRVLFFGPEKAFLPMTIGGALASEAQYLEKGMFVVLPDDAHGRVVLYTDRARCNKDIAPRESIVRCFWYFWQCLSEKNQSLVHIIGMKGFDLYKHFDRIMVKRFVMCSSVMPILWKAGHLYMGSGCIVYSTLVLPVIKHMLGQHFRLRMNYHTGSSHELQMSFQSFGLSAAHVDAVFSGATKNCLLVKEWLEQRRIVEEQHLSQSLSP